MQQPQRRLRPIHALPPVQAGQVRPLGMPVSIWQRYTSPWSLYTRLAMLPFLLTAMASHAWLGTQAAIGLTLLIFVLLWATPRLLPASRNQNSWSARATFGERVWINRMAVPIPQDEAKTAMRLSLVTGAGFVVAVYGAVTVNPILAASGLIVTYAGKLAFLDRMAQLYGKMRDAHPLYRFWSISPDNDNRKA